MTPLDLLAIFLGLALGIATVLPSVVLLIHFSMTYCCPYSSTPAALVRPTARHLPPAPPGAERKIIST